MLARSALIGISVTLLILPINAAFAQVGELCFEDTANLCGLISGDPSTFFSGILTPLESQVAGFSLVILWGGLLAIVWFKTENIMLLGIVGVAISATITGLSPTAQGVGMLMLGLSIGILLFQLIRQRISVFS